MLRVWSARAATANGRQQHQSDAQIVRPRVIGNLPGAMLLLAATLLFGGTAQAQTAIRINAAGPAYTDTSGNSWLADTGYLSGTPADWGSVTVNGTSDPTIYRTERWDSNIRYALTVPNGTYTVKLHFVEHLFNSGSNNGGVGQRVFSIELEGSTVATGVDVFAQAGAHTALIKTYTVSVTDGTMNIRVYSQVEDAEINGIEILAQGGGDTTGPTVPTGLSATASGSSVVNLSWNASTDNVGVTGYRVERCSGSGCSNFAQIATPTGTSYSNTGLTASTSYSYRVRATDAAGNFSAYSSAASAVTGANTTAIRINAGGAAFTDSASNSWLADTGYNSGGGTGNWQGTISGTSDPTIYRFERWNSDLQYAVAVPNGAYTVKLHFAENYFDSSFPNGGVGQRVFSIALEGATVATGIDVAAQVGAHTALIKTYTVSVADGTMNIRLFSQVEDAEINGIEILAQGGGGDTTAPSTPSGLSATPSGSTVVNLSWSASSDNVGVTGYRVERCSGSGCSNFTQIATPGSNSYSDSGLAASTSYTYRVRATDAAGNLSSYSSTASATTNSGSGTVIRVNAGGSAFTDPSGNSWQADTGYNSGGGTGNFGNISISGTSNPTLYRTERWNSDLQYAFTVPNDTYTVKLHLAENYYDSAFPNGGAGYRVFSIALEGSTVATGIDVAAQVGGHTALVKTYTVNVTDGTLNIRLFSQVEDAEINGIEILGQGGGTDTSAPSTPTGLSASSASGASVNLNWNASTDNVAVTGYSVERCTGSSCSAFSEIATASSNSYADNSAAPNTTYKYRVRARDAIPNWSSYSATASATTPNAPGAPVGVSAAPNSSSSITLSWSAPGGSPPAARYLIGQCEGAGCTNFNTIVTDLYPLTYTDSGLTANTTYRYRVLAIDANGNVGPASAIVASTTSSGGGDTQAPSVPGGLTATAVSGTQINLSWAASTDNVGVTGYGIERCADANCTAFATVATVTGTSYNNIGLTPATLYRYRVRAWDAAGNASGYSSTASATTVAGAEAVTYEYDALGRLTEVTHAGTVNNNVQTTYELDAAGNRTNVTVVAP